MAERKNELMSSASPITTPSARPARAGALGGPRAMTRAVAHAENAAWAPSRGRFPLVSTAVTFFNGDFLGWRPAVSPVHVGLFADFQLKCGKRATVPRGAKGPATSPLGSYRVCGRHGPARRANTPPKVALVTPWGEGSDGFLLSKTVKSLIEKTNI